MTHIDAETLAALAEGRLTRKEIAPVLVHLRECAECTSDVEFVAASAARSERPRRELRWIAVAAAAVIAIVAAALLLRPRDPMQRLVSLVPRSARIIEPRLTAFAWSPYRGPMRAGDPAEDARRLQLAGAAGDAVARANADPSAEAQWTAGVALLLVGEPENALKRLRSASDLAPRDAAIASDLAAALDASAVRLERKSLHADALAAADRALAANPSHPGALFNRALILEHLGLNGEARKAWSRYLEVDASSPWANEARDHLRQLPRSTGDARFRAEQGDLRRVAALVPDFPQQSRTYAEGIYLARWGASNDVAALDAARTIGDALVKRSGESLLRDSVQVIDAAAGERRAQLAAAHALYSQARIALSRGDSVHAQRDLERAAAMFGASPMSLAARYFAACARFEADDVDGAREDLERLLAESSAHPGYLALNAQIEWQLATVAMSDADWARALEFLNGSERRFRQLGERSNLGFIRGMQSMAMASLGRPEDAWAARIDAFRALDAEGQADRLPVSLGGAARMELYAGRVETARAFLHLEVEAVRDTKNDALLANALVREALLQAELGDDAAAARAAHDAMTAALVLSGPAREIAMADAHLAQGAAALHDDVTAARIALTSAIGSYRTSKRAVFLPQAYLLRARAALRNNDRGSALRDLDDGVEVLERHRRRLAGPLVGTDILDAGVALGREAIRLRAEMNDVPGAFREAERHLLRMSGAAESPIALDTLQRRLSGSSTAVLMLLALPGETIAITVDEAKVAIARAPFDLHALDARIRGAADGERDDAAALYDALIRPSAETVAAARRLIVVADPLLREVPFAALYDRVTQRHLIEVMPVAVAENASSLRAGPAEASRLTVAVALPSAGLDVLPDAQREIDDVGAIYPRTVSLSRAATFEAFANAVAHAGIVHIAGHTSRTADERALPFAQRNATWRDLAEMPFEQGAVVILSACETLRCPDLRQTHALSLGGGVLAGGAGDVIGTLEPIADHDAAELFGRIHRGLAAGLDAADALRRAQLDALASEVATGRRLPWRAVALLTRRIARDAA